jgi:hypothetical protein
MPGQRERVTSRSTVPPGPGRAVRFGGRAASCHAGACGRVISTNVRPTFNSMRRPPCGPVPRCRLGRMHGLVVRSTGSRGLAWWAGQAPRSGTGPTPVRRVVCMICLSLPVTNALRPPLPAPGRRTRISVASSRSVTPSAAAWATTSARVRSRARRAARRPGGARGRRRRYTCRCAVVSDLADRLGAFPVCAVGRTGPSSRPWSTAGDCTAADRGSLRGRRPHSP